MRSRSSCWPRTTRNGPPRSFCAALVERCGAETGFVVVREEGSYQQKFEVGEERGRRSDLERRFSRTLVREAIATGALLYLPNLIEDPRFAAGESGLVIGRCCVLVAPLRHAGEVYGVVYLENRERVDSFTPENRAFLTELAEIAGLFLKRASDREELRRRNRSLERDLFAQHDFEGIVTRDPADARAAAGRRAGGRRGRSDARAGRDRHRQGADRPRAARQQPAPRARPSSPSTAPRCPAPCSNPSSSATSPERSPTPSATVPGRLASAHGGTLFLDEVGEIPVEAQAKLLRFLQFGEIQRLGSDRTEKVDVRIVAATHRDLRQMVQERRFREDLYFRLKVLDLTLPPLRERRGDVPLLADHFLRRSLAAPRREAALDAAGRAGASGLRLSGQRPRAGARRRAGLPAGPRAGARPRPAAAGDGGRGAAIQRPSRPSPS